MRVARPTPFEARSERKSADNRVSSFGFTTTTPAQVQAGQQLRGGK